MWCLRSVICFHGYCSNSVFFFFPAQEREFRLECEFCCFWWVEYFLLRVNVANLSLTEKMLILFYVMGGVIRHLFTLAF